MNNIMNSSRKKVLSIAAIFSLLSLGYLYIHNKRKQKKIEKISPFFYLSEEEANFRSKNISNVFYLLLLDLSTPKSYKGKVKVKFYLNEPTEGLFLDWVGSVLLFKVNDQEMNAKNCLSEHKLMIPKQNQLKGENEILLEFSNSYSKNGVGLSRFDSPDEKIEIIYSQFEPSFCHFMFPCFDQPDIKCHIQLCTIIPISYQVVSSTFEEEIDSKEENEEKEKEKEKQNRKEEIDLFLSNSSFSNCLSLKKFKVSELLSTYIFSIFAGTFNIISDKDNKYTIQRIICVPKIAGKIDSKFVFQLTKDGIEFYQNLLGTEYPFKKTDHIIIPFLEAEAMENVGCISYSEEKFLYDKYSDKSIQNFAVLLLHELAHMWFGNLISIQWWGDTWVKEGLATFLSTLCFSELHQYKFYKCWENNLHAHLEWAYAYDCYLTNHPIKYKAHNNEIARIRFDGITYVKAMYFLFQYKEIYDNKNCDNLKKSFKFFFDNFRNSSVNTDIFLSCFKKNKIAKTNEESIHLESFFDNWIYKKGINKILPKVETQEGIIKEFIIKYKSLNNNEELYPQKITILIFNENYKITDKLDILLLPKQEIIIKEMEGKKQPFAFYLGGNPFTYAHVYIDNFSKKNLMEQIEKIQDQHIQYRILKSLYTMTDHFLILPTDFLYFSSQKLKFLKSEFNLDYILNCTQCLIEKGIPTSLKMHYYKIFLNEIIVTYEKESRYEVKKILVNYLFKFALKSSQKLKIYELLRPPKNIVTINTQTREIITKNIGENSNIEEIELVSIQELAFALNSDNNLESNINIRNSLIDQIRKELKGNDLNKFNDIIMITEPSKKSKLNFWEIFINNYRDSFINIIFLMERFWLKEQLDLKFMSEFIASFFKEIIPIYNKFGVIYGDKFFDYLFPPYINQDMLGQLNSLKNWISEEIYSLKEKTERKIEDIEKYLKMQKISKYEES